MKRLCLITLGIFLLTSCSMFSPIKKGPEQGYVINAAPKVTSKMTRRNATLLVYAPETNSVYDSRRIAFSTKPYQITYYSFNHWVGTPSTMIHPLLVETLQNSKRYRSVISPPYVGNYDYALRTEIEKLKVDYTHKVPVLQMTLQAQLINANTNNLVSSREFSAIVPLQAKTPYAAVIAANQATSRILGNLVKWTTKLS